MKITNQIFKREGKHYTRCWYVVKEKGVLKQKTYEVPTDLSAIRPERESLIWKPEPDKSDTSIRKALQAAGITGPVGGPSI